MKVDTVGENDTWDEDNVKAHNNERPLLQALFLHYQFPWQGDTSTEALHISLHEPNFESSCVTCAQETALRFSFLRKIMKAQVPWSGSLHSARPFERNLFEKVFG